MSESVYVKVSSVEEAKSIVTNHGIDFEDFDNIGGVIKSQGYIIVELKSGNWVWCDEDYYKHELGSDFVPLSYKEYMKKYGHTDWTPDPEYDAINPSHYKQFDRETIDTMKGMSTPEEFRGHLKLTAVKYISRYQGKNGIQDIEKAIWYMERLKKELIDEQSNTTN